MNVFAVSAADAWLGDVLEHGGLICFPGISFTRSYSDEASHPNECGDIAQTDVTFRVFRLASVSVLSVLELTSSSTLLVP
jgi:hypothetical protein